MVRIYQDVVQLIHSGVIELNEFIRRVTCDLSCELIMHSRTAPENWKFQKLVLHQRYYLKHWPREILGYVQQKTYKRMFTRALFEKRK